jgi:hypothetical protein
MAVAGGVLQMWLPFRLEYMQVISNREKRENGEKGQPRK